MEKKNPYITTIGFKRDDPDHVYVAELLNSMSRGKAQYIVKAVLIYQELQQKEHVRQSSEISCDYEDIKRIVLQIIEERETQKENLIGTPCKVLSEPVKKKDILQEFDEDVLNNIMVSIAAFRNQ